jgi:hypothetical protein
MARPSTVNITLDLYSHVTPTIRKEAVNAPGFAAPFMAGRVAVGLLSGVVVQTIGST